jgi:hypothetical protein
VTVQLAPDGPRTAATVRDMHAWRNAYPWLQQALDEVGPGARRASDSWRVRIEEELKTTLDFKVRPDGTATVWCGMSGHEFHHYPTTKELLAGLGEAYRQERERRKRIGSGERRRIAGARPTLPDWPPLQMLPQPIKDSLARALGAVLLPRVEQLAVILLSVTALTLALAVVALVVR